MRNEYLFEDNPMDIWRAGRSNVSYYCYLVVVFNLYFSGRCINNLDFACIAFLELVLFHKCRVAQCEFPRLLHTRSRSDFGYA